MSERTAVEIILKLIELKKVNLIFSKSGREYVTPAQVVEEVEMELTSHNGRVTLVDLAPILNLDLNHIETAARALCAKKKSIVELSGQLLTSWYLDGVVEEVNESLQESGSIGIVELAQRFSLPADFMRQTIEQRLGTLVTGYIEDGQLYTQAFIQLHTSRTRGAFRALVKPTLLKAVIQRHGLMESRVFKELTTMIKDGTLSGTLKGADDRAMYTPTLFLRAQTAGAEAFFSANGFVEYKKLERLQVSNPKAFIQAKFPTALHLQSLALSEGLVSGCVLACEDAATARLYANAQAILPSVLSRQEVEQVLQHSIEQVNKQQQKSSTDASATAASTLTVMGEIWSVSGGFRAEAQRELLRQVESYMDAEDVKVAEAAALAAEESMSSSTPASSAAAANPAKKQKPVAAEDDEEEDAPAAQKSAGGKSASASKSKAAGKKGKRGGDSSDEAEDEKPVAPVKKSKGAIKPAASGAGASPPLTRDRLKKWLTSGWSSIAKASQKGNAEIQQAEVDESTDELVGLLAAALHPACLAVQKARVASRVAAAAALLAAGSSSSSSSSGVSGPLGPGGEMIIRRAQLEAFRTALQEQYEQCLQYQHAIDYIASGGDVPSAPLKADKALLGALEAHLSKTLATSLVDLLVRMEAFSSLTPAHLEKLHGCAVGGMLTLAPSVPVTEGMTIAEKAAAQKQRYEVTRSPLPAKDRDTVLAVLPKKSSESLKPLVDALNKDACVVLERFDLACRALDHRVKPLDKKSERSRIFAVRKTLMLQLAQETRPPVVLQLVVLLVFAKVFGVVPHAPARVIPALRRMLRPALQPVAYAKIRRYNQLVVKQIRGEAAGSDDAASAVSSSSTSALDSDEELAAADEELPPELQVKHMPPSAIDAELVGGIGQIAAYGQDAATAVKAK